MFLLSPGVSGVTVIVVVTKMIMSIVVTTVCKVSCIDNLGTIAHADCSLMQG